MENKKKEIMPLVSVVIPVYNGEKYLKETIESVLNQTYKNWELILVDDASTDRSFQIIKNYSNKYPHKIKIIRHSENKGCPAATKNTGIKLAKGKYITFLDQDDIWKRNKLVEQIKMITSKSNLVANFTNGYILDNEKSKIIAKQWVSINSYPSQQEIIQNLLKKNFILTSSSALVKKNVLIKLGGFDEKMKLADDYDLWFRLSNIGNLSFIKTPLFLWRFHKKSLSHNEEKHLIDLIYFYKKILSSAKYYNLEKKLIIYYLAKYLTRMGNFYLANRKIKKAQNFYKISLSYLPNQLFTKTILNLSKIFPFFAYFIVKLKRGISQRYS